MLNECTKLDALILVTHTIRYRADFLDAFAHVHPLRMVSCSLAALSGKTKHYMLKLELPVNNSREIFTLKIFVP